MKWSPCLKSNWSGGIKSFSIKNEYISLYIRRSNIFLKTGRSKSGRQFLTFFLLNKLAILKSKVNEIKQMFKI